MASASPLATELSVFEANKLDWVQSHLGQFVVIRDETAMGQFFDDYEDAFRAGIRHFGGERNFLVKQIWKTEPVYFVA